MRIEADGINDIDVWSRFENGQQSRGILHESIFYNQGVDLSFSGKEVAIRNSSSEDKRMEMVFSGISSLNNPIIAGSRAHGSAEVSLDVSWGGSEGTKVEATVTAEVSHDSGAYVEASASQDSNGQGSASVDAGVESKPSN